MIASYHPPDFAYYTNIKKAAFKIKNLKFLGFVPHEKINRYYQESSFLVNTSPSEGFPNTFLEAWGNSIPIITLGFDPDEIICKYKLGLHVKDFNELITNVEMLQNNHH